jgi:nucleoside-diphosphate-sugar epimerase
VKIFVAGATGVIGRSLVALLVRGGHDVVGMTSSTDKVEQLRSLAATAVVCDALDAEAVARAVVDAAPEAIVHELTRIPPKLDPRRYAEQFAATDRLRTEGTRNLVDAALAAGARRFVAQSVAFAYAPGSGTPKTEEDALYFDAPREFRGRVEAIRELERLVLETPGLEGIVLRYGYLYGPGTAWADGGHMASLVRKRRLPIVGRGTGVWSFVHVGDAAAATVAAVERGRAGVYNVVDDEPAPVAEWLPVYAGTLNARRPFRVPAIVARLGAGKYGAEMMTKASGASNAKAKQELGWHPAHASWRDGFRANIN